MSAPNDQPNRRGSDRFSIEREICYRVIKRGSKEAFEYGKSLNISGSGVMFTTKQRLPLARRLEIEIDWPAKLDDKCALKLVAQGQVVRSEAGLSVLEFKRQEFRTKRSGAQLA